MTTSIAVMHFPSFSVVNISRAARIIGLLALCAVLSACSAIKLGYNNIGEVAYWWLDGYVDFSDEQAVRVREDLARLHAWHRRQELPQLAALLRTMEELAPGDITPAQACAFVPALRARINALTDRGEPAIVTTALDLAPEQLTHLERKFERINNDYRKDWLRLNEAAIRDKRFDAFVDRSETIYGSLDEPQRRVARAQIEQSIFDPKRFLEERRRRQQDLLQTLRKLATPPQDFGQARSLIRGYLARVQESPDASYRTYEQALIQESCRTFSALHNSTTAAQRDAAVRRLRAYQRDLRELASQQ